MGILQCFSSEHDHEHCVLPNVEHVTRVTQATSENKMKEGIKTNNICKLRKNQNEITD